MSAPVKPRLLDGAAGWLLLGLCVSAPAFLAPAIEAAVAKNQTYSLESGETTSFGGKASSSSSGSSMSSGGGAFQTVAFTGANISMLTGVVAMGHAPGRIPRSPLDIAILYAKTDPFGTQIPPQTWQKDADPVFIWEPPTPGLEVAGYSYAIDAEPDNTIDTTQTSWNVANDPLGSLLDGQHTFSVKAFNSAMQAGAPMTFTIWIDTTPPTISSSSPPPGTLLNTLAPSIVASVTDFASGIDASGIVLSINGSVAQVSFDPVTGVVTASGAGLTQDGANNLELEVTDRAGNTQTPLVWSFIVDTTPPTGQVSINAGGLMTTNVYVTLNLTASDDIAGVARMLISNDALTGFTEEPFVSARDLWRLIPVRGPRRVYVKFIDAVGNVSEPVSDEIELQLLAPETVILSGPAGLSSDRAPKFTFGCPEQSCLFSFAFDHGQWSEWTTDVSAVASELPFGNHYFKVKAAKDVNGAPGIQPDEEDPTPAERTWIVGVEVPVFPIPRGAPIKLWRLE